MPPNQRYRVGVDIGGTFTDLIVVDQETGAFAMGKVLTTSDDPSRAVETALAETLRQAGIAPGAVRNLVHGTTLVTNALIERKGAPTALLTTAGFRDSVAIGREQRYDLYDLLLEQPRPLVPRYLRFDVPQRTLADGSTDVELDITYVERLARELAANGIAAAAIVFLHSFTNPADERAAREALQRAAPGIRVSISSDVVPEIREFERASTTIANVYVQDLVERYLRTLQVRLRELGLDGDFFLMLSSGGIATVDTAARYPVRLLESGPAAGALAATVYGQAAGHPNLLSFDMGGTTAKICVIDGGQPLIAQSFEVDRIYRFKKGSGMPITIPVIEMIEIGTGGGSIARVDSLGLLKVGPDSAGSAPGPVCYGRGGAEPTVTDADLVLGYLDPGYFLGGKMALDVAGARAAIAERVAARLGMSVEQAAWGIHQIANENMANAARVHVLERGKDPHRFPMFAFGGAGPVHAYRIALSLGVPTLLLPFGAGVMSTLGFLSAPLAFDFVRSWREQLQAMDWARANALLEAMEAEGRALLEASGVAPEAISHRREADMRYVGQGHEIRVPLPPGALGAAHTAALQAAFEAAYRELYERLGPAVPLEILNWRVVSSGPRPSVALSIPAAASSDIAQARKGERLAYFPEAGGFVSTPIYDRYRLAPGMAFAGPAIVEERESTAIVGPGARCRVDEQWNLVVDLEP
ncbi:MAG TPA: hydantoinase/oxoprolinase family protein [Kouleothrix sp.]|uniref:hydantoinase/oxoprolinase family protein n=1 Tax=Kouleothrix sp. TaxID=2779161 RepID=UPI002D04E69E|nr:hydantoinase/oxoprolinase family protein [Kouleothrix sp.]HRC75973.1 hydantoinase/oxoprolinase family protein [Kouleothrix sp.]